MEAQVAWVGTASALDGEHGWRRRRRQPTNPGRQPTGNLGSATKINHAAFFELDESDPAGVLSRSFRL